METPQFIRDLHTNQRLLLLELMRRGVRVDPVALDLELVRVCYNGRSELLLDRDSSLVPLSLCEVVRNKALAASLLKEQGVSVVAGHDFPFDLSEEAIAFAGEIGFPVVVKPNIGSHGDGVYMNLCNAAEVREAIHRLKKQQSLTTTFLIEAQFSAPEYRVFITRDGRYAVLHRDPAHIIGDGFSTVSDLIERENYARMNPRTTCLTPIVVDDIVELHLAKQGRSIEDVPERLEKVYLRASSNLAKGGTCEDFTERVHPSVLQIASLALQAFPGLPYAGIDFLSLNIEAPQTEESYRVIEVNPSPGLHMHMRPARGATQDVAAYLADLLFPETRQ